MATKNREVLFIIVTAETEKPFKIVTDFHLVLIECFTATRTVVCRIILLGICYHLHPHHLR
jgi:hypothetical protein